MTDCREYQQGHGVQHEDRHHGQSRLIVISVYYGCHRRYSTSAAYSRAGGNQVGIVPREPEYPAQQSTDNHHAHYRDYRKEHSVLARLHG